MKKPWLQKGAIFCCVFFSSLASTPAVLAFCGFFVAKADSNLHNSASQVVIARNGNRSVFTMANNFEGDVKDFARIVPIPVIPTRDQIRIGSNEAIEKLDGFTAPRLAQYIDSPCTQEHQIYLIVGISVSLILILVIVVRAAYRRNKIFGLLLFFFLLLGLALVVLPFFLNQTLYARYPSYNQAMNLKIEDQFTVGEYDIVLLSATQSSGLIQWLLQNDYQVPENAQAMLQDYINQGMKFFVVRVNLEAFQKEGYGFLRPIVIEYESPQFMLPIRLGTLNAKTDQDLIIHILSQTEYAEVANYDTVLIPTDAKSQKNQVSGEELPSFIENEFGDFYESVFQKEYEKHGKNVVFLEYAGNTHKCDPCSNTPPNGPPDFNGLDPFLSKGELTGEYHYITRLHVRYTAEKFPEDLIFQPVRPQELLERVKAENKYFPNKAGTVFQGRYVVRKTQNNSTLCLSGLPYWFNNPSQHLAKLTGWDQQEIKAKSSAYDQAVNWYTEGEKRERQQDYQGALEAYSQALQFSPDQPTYRFKKGLALYYLNRHEEALAIWETIPELPNPEEQRYLDRLKEDLRQERKP